MQIQINFSDPIKMFNYFLVKYELKKKRYNISVAGLCKIMKSFKSFSKILRKSENEFYYIPVVYEQIKFLFLVELYAIVYIYIFFCEVKINLGTEKFVSEKKN